MVREWGAGAGVGELEQRGVANRGGGNGRGVHRVRGTWLEHGRGGAGLRGGADGVACGYRRCIAARGAGDRGFLDAVAAGAGREFPHGYDQGCAGSGWERAADSRCGVDALVLAAESGGFEGPVVRGDGAGRRTGAGGWRHAGDGDVRRGRALHRYVERARARGGAVAGGVGLRAADGGAMGAGGEACGRRGPCAG